MELIKNRNPHWEHLNLSSIFYFTAKEERAYLSKVCCSLDAGSETQDSLLLGNLRQLKLHPR